MRTGEKNCGSKASVISRLLFICPLSLSLSLSPLCLLSPACLSVSPFSSSSSSRPPPPPEFWAFSCATSLYYPTPGMGPLLSAKPAVSQMLIDRSTRKRKETLGSCCTAPLKKSHLETLIELSSACLARSWQPYVRLTEPTQMLISFSCLCGVCSNPLVEGQAFLWRGILNLRLPSSFFVILCACLSGVRALFSDLPLLLSS